MSFKNFKRSVVLYLRVPAEICGVDEEDTGAGHGGRGGRLEVGDLEQEPHARGERDPLVTRERQDLVVVHDGVERLDPHGVDVSVQHDPARVVARHLSEVSHDHREQT